MQWKKYDKKYSGIFFSVSRKDFPAEMNGILMQFSFILKTKAKEHYDSVNSA